jgi:uncharacterized protein YndB with AHSA1/START domain
MDKNEKNNITVEVSIKDDIEKIWELWNLPEHIIKWYFGSEDWHTPRAENDLRQGGRFLFRMEAKDGSFGFDFSGIYDKVKKNELIEYTIPDGRKVVITFNKNGSNVIITEKFETENTNSPEKQRSGWQAILNNFKKYAEA